MRKRLFLLSILLAPCTALAEPVSTDREYLEELHSIVKEFYCSSVYYQANFLWPIHERKTDRLIELEERTSGSAISNVARSAVLTAITLDLMGLTLADSRVKPFTSSKLSPIARLPSFFERTQKLGNPALQPGVDLRDFVYKAVKKGPGTSVRNYASTRTRCGNHAAWQEIVAGLDSSNERVAQFQKNAATTDPYWSFHGGPMGWMGVSDNLPLPRKGWTPINAGKLGRVSEGPFKVEFEGLTGTNRHVFEIDYDKETILNVLIVCTEGAAMIGSGGSKALDWEDGEDFHTKGKFSIEISPRHSPTPILLDRVEIPEFERFSKPSSGYILIWAGEQEKPSIFTSVLKIPGV